LFGIGVHAATMPQVVALCKSVIESRQELSIGVVNVAKIVSLQRDPFLFDAVSRCDLVLADGMAVVWASRLLRRPLPDRIAGIDLFENLLVLADACGLSIYLLGATRDVLDKVIERMRDRYPRARIAGSRDGYFREPESQAVASEIRQSGADMLFVGMTSPKKELFMARWGGLLGVPIRHGVGGSFDVYAGKVRRAPRLWQKFGMEWLYRVFQEPRRLWRRYLVTNVQFILMLLREALGGPLPGSKGSIGGSQGKRASGAKQDVPA